VGERRGGISALGVLLPFSLRFGFAAWSQDDPEPTLSVLENDEGRLREPVISLPREHGR
jgi:hypothetical protein